MAAKSTPLRSSSVIAGQFADADVRRMRRRRRAQPGTSASGRAFLSETRAIARVVRQIEVVRLEKSAPSRFKSVKAALSSSIRVRQVAQPGEGARFDARDLVVVQIQRRQAAQPGEVARFDARDLVVVQIQRRQVAQPGEVARFDARDLVVVQIQRRQAAQPGEVARFDARDLVVVQIQVVKLPSPVKSPDSMLVIWLQSKFRSSSCPARRSRPIRCS